MYFRIVQCFVPIWPQSCGSCSHSNTNLLEGHFIALNFTMVVNNFLSNLLRQFTPMVHVQCGTSVVHSLIPSSTVQLLTL